MRAIDKILKDYNKNPELFVLATEYENNCLFAYMDLKDEYRKPNHVSKMRHRAIKRQCYKRAKKELERKKRVRDVFDRIVERNGDALTRLSKG